MTTTSTIASSLARAAEPIGAGLEYLVRGTKGLPRPSFIGGNSAHLLTSTDSTMTAIVDAVRGAQNSVDVAMFSLAQTGNGAQLIDELAAAAARGVEVNVQLDQVGTFGLTPFAATRMVKDMRTKGINVVVNPRFTLRDGIETVDHRKLVVADGRVAITGGMNIADRFSEWHDAMVRIEGPLAAQAAAQFAARWVEEGGAVSARKLMLLERLQTPQGATVAAASAATTDARAGAMMLLANHPGTVLDATDTLHQQIGAAKSRIWIASPWLTNRQVVDDLKAAAERGVDVRVAMMGEEAWATQRPMQLLSTLFYRDLLESGVKLFEQPGTSHMKTWVIDNAATVGSVNLTRRATHFDHELAVVSQDPKFVGQVEQLVKSRFDVAKPITQDDVDSAPMRVLSTLREKLRLQY